MGLRVTFCFVCLVCATPSTWGSAEYQLYMKQRLWEGETKVEAARHNIESLDVTDSTDDVTTLHDEVKAETFGDEIRSMVESVSDSISKLPAESLLSTDNRTTVKKIDQRIRQYWGGYGSLYTHLTYAIGQYQNAADRQATLDSENSDDSDDETPTGHICGRLGDDPDQSVDFYCGRGAEEIAAATEVLEEVKALKTEIDGLLDDLVEPTTEE